MKDTLVRMFDHSEWADRKVLAKLRELSGVPEKVMKVYAHVLAAEHLWLSRVRGQAATLAVWPELSLDQCEAALIENHSAFRRLLSESTEEDLDRQITYRNTKGVVYTNALHDILTHVALHGTYHRGQVASHLRSASLDPVDTDFIVYIRKS